MFQLSQQDIHLGATASNKQEAIRQVAAALTKAGCVSAPYVDGMLQRELQTSTYLGNGIAIPHGTTDTRDLVLNTGVQVFQFPQGIEWGEGQTAYVVIGIAARSDEHLALLRQLTHVLSDDSVAEQLAKTTSAEELRSLLMGEKLTAEFKFDASLIALDVAADSLMTLQALNAGRLQKIGAVNAQFVSDVITRKPLNLGQVFQFPQGIEWGEGQTAYVVIGIAARSDEHLALLRQLTHVLSDDSVAEQLAKTTSAEELRSLLMGEKLTAEFKFDASLIALDVAADSLMTLQALNAGRLQKIGAVNAQFVSDVITRKPLNLGQGIWLSDSTEGNLASAATVSRPAQPFDEEGEQVALLLTLSVADSQPLAVLNYLSDLLLANKAERLLNADAVTLLALLTSEVEEENTTLSAEYVIRNEHGLHARPGTALVNVIKQFSSEITVTNLDGSGKPANGRSLMKVVALGVKKGHHLRFTAKGEDAETALKAIGEAINEGLGEGAA